MFDSAVTFLYVRDLAVSDAFYAGALGLQLGLNQGSCHIYRAAAGGFLGVCQRPDLPDQPGLATPVIVTLVTRQVDEWYGRMSRAGVTFEKAPILNPTYNIYHCILRDPDGYLIEIQQFLDLTWPG